MLLGELTLFQNKKLYIINCRDGWEWIVLDSCWIKKKTFTNESYRVNQYTEWVRKSSILTRFIFINGLTSL